MADISHTSSASTSETDRASTLPVEAIRDSINAQLKASSDIFRIVQAIAEVAGKIGDQKIRDSLEQTMRELLETGKHLSTQATNTGKQILDFMNAR